MCNQNILLNFYFYFCFINNIFLPCLTCHSFNFSFSIPQSPSPSSAELTSPSNPQTSPGEYNPTSDHRSHSPPPIDIHAQFLAGLRHLGDHRPSSPIEAEHSRAGYTSPQDNLPPRKRKVSQDHDRSKMSSLHEKMASLPEKMADMNGLHERDRNMAPVN